MKNIDTKLFVRRSFGFNLIEVITVITIISILLAMILVWTIPKFRQNSLSSNSFSVEELTDKFSNLLTDLKEYGTSVPVSVTQNCIPNGTIFSSIIDTNNGYAYFSVLAANTPARIIKVRLSDFSLNAILTLKDKSEAIATWPVIDSNAGYLYYASRTSTSQSTILKIRLSDFTELPALNLTSGGNFGNMLAGGGVLNPNNGYMYYFASGTAPNKVVKIRLSDFSDQGVLNLNSAELETHSPLIDVNNGYIYAAARTISYDRIVKIRLSDFTELPALSLKSAEHVYYSYGAGVIDTTHGYVYYYIVNNSMPQIAKIRLSDFTELPVLNLTSTENSLTTGVIDVNAGYAYFVSNNTGNPENAAKLLKIRLSDFTELPPLALGTNEINAGGMVIDPANGYIYGARANINNIPTIMKFRLSDFTRVLPGLGIMLPLKGLNFFLYDPPVAGQSSLILQNCGNNDGNFTTGINVNFPSQVINNSDLPSNLHTVDTNGNPANYSIYIISNNPDPNKIGNVVISRINADGTILATDLRFIRITDGKGNYFDIYINQFGMVSVKKE